MLSGVAIESAPAPTEAVSAEPLAAGEATVPRGERFSAGGPGNDDDDGVPIH
jgi:hypothetical protein